MEEEMNIPLGTEVRVKPGFLARLLGNPARAGKVVDVDVDTHDGEENKARIYVIRFEDGTEAEYLASKLIAPEFCKCGNQMDEVIFIPGTGGCFACHELRVMEKTGVGVALLSPLGAYVVN